MIIDIKFLTPQDNFKLTKDPNFTEQYGVNALATVGSQYSVWIERHGSYWVIAAEDHDYSEMESAINCPNKFRSIKAAQVKVNEFCDFFLACWLENNDPIVNPDMELPLV